MTKLVAMTFEEASKWIASQEDRIRKLEAELNEQARVNGMGGSREAALLAKVARLEKALREIAVGLTAEDAVAGFSQRYQLCAGRLCKIARDALTAPETKGDSAVMGLPDITQIAKLNAQLADQSERINRLKELRDVNASLEEALREIADLPEEYVSGKYAHEWLMSNPPKHAVVYSLREKARTALNRGGVK